MRLNIKKKKTRSDTEGKRIRPTDIKMSANTKGSMSIEGSTDAEELVVIYYKY